MIKRTLYFLALVTACCWSTLGADETNAPAGTTAPAAAAPKLKAPGVEERLADLEAYVNNGARGNAANTNLDTKVAGPGPGHNAFQMVCAAPVLFMTQIGRAHV